jgi:mRNA interferase HicA
MQTLMVAAPTRGRCRVRGPGAFRSGLRTTTVLLYNDPAVTSQEFKRWLQNKGCTFEPGRGGHLVVRLGDKITDLPMHGKQKELGTGLVNSIKKHLGLK